MKTKEYRLTFSVWIGEEYGERREIAAERQISTYRVPAGYVLSEHEKEQLKDYLWNEIKKLDRCGTFKNVMAGGKLTTEEAIKLFEECIIPCGEFDFNDKEKEVLEIVLNAAKKVNEWEEYKDECDSYHTK